MRRELLRERCPIGLEQRAEQRIGGMGHDAERRSDDLRHAAWSIVAVHDPIAPVQPQQASIAFGPGSPQTPIASSQLPTSTLST
jgi:hypothetical protein